MNLTKYKLSSRDIKLIIIMIALGLLLASYRFVYYPNMHSTKNIQKEIRQLKVREDELLLENSKADEVKEENVAMAMEINKTMNRYGAGATIQKTLIFLENLEKESNMDISAITFSDPESIYCSTPESVNTSMDENTQVDSSSSSENIAQADDSSTSDENNSMNVETTENSNTLSTEDTANLISSYNSVVTIDFKVSNDGLKKSIDFINNNSERKNIKEINIVYDMETGNLSGTMAINMYQLANMGKMYEDPAIAGVTIGKPNIFGTIEVTGDINN